MSESEVQAEIMLTVSRGRSRIFRNNQGVATFPDGRRVRYGICNPGGSDLLGWVSVVVTPEMVGKPVAVFAAIEVKKPGGRIKPEQQNFIDVVNAAGGIAGIAHNADEARAIVERKL